MPEVQENVVEQDKSRAYEQPRAPDVARDAKHARALPSTLLPMEKWLGAHVEQAQVLEHFDQHFLVSYRFYRHAIVTTVYNTEFDVDYQLPDSKRWYCFARAIRIAEVQNPGKPDEKELSVGNDHGYMWRLNLYTRYLEKDNGVYVQIEFVALSRSAPGIVAWLANSYIRSIPTAYLTNYVRTTQRALASQERFSGN